ncbi:Pycsar system effector family protein [Faecalicatena contorta]|uniref:Pycsar system effector family protein n=1 Tax=Faecalicatena contorta TaxID=39482 RepID=UPI00189A4ED7|nr:Pycsar system effector family protein [Faecalicatena contorta]
MNDNKHHIVQELLQEIYSNINNWLAFAEAKNAAIIAFNIACISFMCNVNWFANVKVLFYVVCIGMLASTIMALISFIPQMGKKIKNKGIHCESDNLIYYRDIAKYSKEDYLKKIFKYYVNVDILDNEILKVEEDYAEEITYNAGICVRKYKWFEYALKVEIIMLLILIIMVVIA